MVLKGPKMAKKISEKYQSITKMIKLVQNLSNETDEKWLKLSGINAVRWVILKKELLKFFQNDPLCAGERKYFRCHQHMQINVILHFSRGLNFT